jgi:hypothetical protein
MNDRESVLGHGFCCSLAIANAAGYVLKAKISVGDCATVVSLP